jgi:predicted DsbA family dithiol-disulfide isomerase
MRNANMDERYGSGGRGPVIRENLRKQFAEVDLAYAPDAHLANTNRSHRLEALAKKKEGDEASWNVGMDLMHAYQVEGKSPADPAVVAEIGVRHGLFSDQAEGEAWVLGNDLDAHTQAGYADARRNGISGVPNFVFQDKYQTSGAIGIDAFKNIIAQIVAKESL